MVHLHERKILWRINQRKYFYFNYGHYWNRLSLLKEDFLNIIGILLIPNAIAASGLAWGVIQMIFCGWLGYFSLMIIVRIKAMLYKSINQF